MQPLQPTLARMPRALGTFVSVMLLVPASDSATVEYHYDANGQLESATYDNGMTVIYRYDANGNRRSVVSSGNWGQDTVPPTIPLSLSGTGISSTRIDLTWTASLDSGGSGVAGYKVERCQQANCSSFQQIAESATISYSDTSALPSTTFRYRVRAYDNAGNHSAYSSVVSASALADTNPPTAPGTPGFSGITSSSAVAAWSPATDDVQVGGYDYALNGGAWTSNGPATSRSLSGLNPATRYVLQVRARDTSGNIGPVASSAFTTLDSLSPSAPGTPSASNINYTSATVSWSAATDNVGVAGYEYRLGASAAFTNVGSATSVNLSALNAATRYTVEVRARDLAGNIGPASQGTFVTTSPTVILPARDGGTRSGNGAVTGYYEVLSSGEIFKPVNGVQAYGGDWLSPKIGAGSFSARASVQSATCEGTFNTWLPLSLSPFWSVTAPRQSGGTALAICVFTLDIRNDTTGTVTTSQIQISALNSG